MKEQPETWKRKTSKEIADCRVFKVRKDFCERSNDGVEHTFFVVENPDWVNVIALTKDEQVKIVSNPIGVGETCADILGDGEVIGV